MQDRPLARELIEAVSQFLSGEIAPTTGDPRLKFRALVAANVLSIVARELEQGEEFTRAEWHRLNALMGDDAPGEDVPAEIEVMTRALCARIRQGKADEGEFYRAALAHIEQTVVEKLQIANPRFLKR
jgi:hypothetical protein